MDYQRIYDLFIVDRRSLDLGAGYRERHHVLPVSIGGSDEASNLVDLSPEDHFFAHLLLAKIHGGRLWVPVVMWLGGNRRNWSGRRSRLRYGWAARSAAAANSGTSAHQYDHRVHMIEHTSGREFQGTQAEIHAALGLDRSGVNMLINKRLDSFHGWFRPDEKPAFVGCGSRKGMNHPMAVGTKMKLRHVDGREFYGTQHELRITHGISKPSACRLAKGQQTVAGGWFVIGKEPSKLGRAASYLKASDKALQAVAAE